MESRPITYVCVITDNSYERRYSCSCDEAAARRTAAIEAGKPTVQHVYVAKIVAEYSKEVTVKERNVS